MVLLYQFTVKPRVDWLLILGGAMFLKVGVTLALTAFALGLAYKCWLWLHVAIGPEARGISAGQRAAAALRGALRLIFSPRLGKALGAFLADGLGQRRVWEHSRLAWLTHFCLFRVFWAFC